MRPAAFALAGALTSLIALSGCASDKLTLFENEDGNATGAVAIIDEQTGADKAVVDTQLTEAKLTRRPRPRAVKQLNPAYNELLDALPLKSAAFTITFATDEVRIPEAQRGTIADIRRALAERPGAQIEVVGFTDRTGDENRNLTISQARALAVANELRESGFSIADEDAVGRGEYAARDSGDADGSSNEKFRKVEVVVR